MFDNLAIFETADIEKGYSGATIEAIAQQAGVAQETIFAVFANKRNLLSTLVDVAVGGDERPVAIWILENRQKNVRSVKQKKKPT